MLARLRNRLRDQRGFGLVELLIAMTVLSVGVFAIVAAYTSTTAALVRASRVATAGVVADKQLELYRALTYAEIRLDDGAVGAVDGTYTGDTSAYSPTQALDVTPNTSCASPLPAECKPTQTVPGPDGRSYRVDTYIVLEYPTTDPAASRQVKKATVVVRDGTTNATLARQITTFDRLSG